MSIYKTSIVTATEFNESYSNLIRKGSPIISDSGIASGFSASNYFQLNKPFNPKSTLWSISVKVTTGVVNANNYILGNFGNTYTNAPQIGVASTANWKIYLPTTNAIGGINATGTYTVLANTDYWLKIYYTGTSYCLDYSLDGINFVTDITLTSAYLLRDVTEGFNIGFNQWSATSTEYWRGSIDLNSLIIRMNDKIVYSPAMNKATVSSYQTTANTFYEI